MAGANGLEFATKLLFSIHFAAESDQAGRMRRFCAQPTNKRQYGKGLDCVERRVCVCTCRGRASNVITHYTYPRIRRVCVYPNNSCCGKQDACVYVCLMFLSTARVAHSVRHHLWRTCLLPRDEATYLLPTTHRHLRPARPTGRLLFGVHAHISSTRI
jgi:hypothetical protein